MHSGANPPQSDTHRGRFGRWQFSVQRMLAATGLAGVAACLLSGVPRLLWPPAQVLAYFYRRRSLGRAWARC